MPNDAIFLISEAGELQRVDYQLYASEDILQDLVAKHPEVLAGDQIDPDAPPRWLLLRREAAIPDSEGGEDRWWLDHLLLDQFGKPTLVEVKRSTDTRIRREVIGQMLDYVANAQTYWVAGRMREMLGAETGSIDAGDQRLTEFLALDEASGQPEEVRRFWQTVETNLRRGNVRLLFVADELPKELKRLIEFLNEQFTNIEVLGVELRQYVGQGIKALVPRVVGQTEAAREQKERSSPNRASASLPWTTRESFIAACTSEAATFFNQVLDDAANRGLQISWGTKGFSLRTDYHPPLVWGYPAGTNKRPTDDVEVYVRDIRDPEKREQVRRRFLELPSAKPHGEYTIRIPVRSSTLSSAERAVSIAIELMM